ncbi:hypothetical protein HN371_25720 [Candidatus Poribacteria bacterium]|jgi:hypothetical protein|nr:hypothetical protein [Candidatus Poribacteria bacterium]MBT5533125.1 hypothetical protein [Candidatus Poribacteria bacterium]MBT5712134.1 hypothetical protein [Candidatus Poribacteria bacterium]MBT7100092.1 hypothetical protein [Candidatus Poribacteria bacterium]MBT7806432.1 hypothetical protein [Candidatus Poribacteria bacterium]
MPKILDYVEYTKSDDGWTSQKIHDEGDFVMERREQDAIDADIREIEAGARPAWTRLGLPRIIVNGETFRARDED